MSVPSFRVVRAQTNGNVVDVFDFIANTVCDEDDTQEHVDQSPPGEIWELFFDISDHRTDKGNEPGELKELAGCDSRGWVGTHNRHGNGGEGERISNDTTKVEAVPGAIVAIHFFDV